MFKEINAIASLKKVASSPMAMASNFAAHALKCLGEKVPHKLSQQVALWSISDVKEWITQVNRSIFIAFLPKFHVPINSFMYSCRLIGCDRLISLTMPIDSCKAKSMVIFCFD